MVALQNRVTPFGDIIATPERGMFLGNRGCLSDESGVLARRRWRLRAWITCQLSYKDWWRPVMQPGVWTELFFMDEATALSAGHRPCALCRRPDYDRYRWSWAKARGLETAAKAIEMDGELHACRVHRNQQKITFNAQAKELPDGVIITRVGEQQPHLIYQGRMLGWTPGGYSGGYELPGAEVTVLTPKPTVDVLAAGYSPVLHPSSQF